MGCVGGSVREQHLEDVVANHATHIVAFDIVKIT
jgi:hypothetical protein